MKKKHLISLWFWASLLTLLATYAFIITQTIIPVGWNALLGLSIHGGNSSIFIDFLLILMQFLSLISLFFYTKNIETRAFKKRLNYIFLLVSVVFPIIQCIIYFIGFILFFLVDFEDWSPS